MRGPLGWMDVIFACHLLLSATYCEALSFSTSSLLRREIREPTETVQAVSIGASQYFEGDDGSSFPLQVGSGNVGGRQDVRVFPSTAGNGIWTIGPLGCPLDYTSDCANSRGGLFLANESLTWTPNSIYQTGIELNLGMNSAGYVGFDHATLGWQGSSTLTDDHSIIWNLATSLYWIGTFGLNPRPVNFSTMADPQTTFMQSLLDRNQIPSLTYGYTAGNQYRLDSVFGSLTIGGYDASRLIPNNVSFDFFEDISRDLLVNLHSVTSDKTSPSDLLPGGSIPIFIDSTVPQLWLPESACSAFEQAFGIEWNDDFSRYLMSPEQRQRLLSQNAEITFTLGPNPTGGETVEITLPYQAFDLQVTFPIVEHPNTSYYFPLMRAANVTQYTLGRTFLQEAYLIADYQRQNFSISQCDWNQDKLQTQNIVTILPPKNATATGSISDSDLSMDVKIGIISGSGALLLILTGLAFYIVNQKRKKRDAQREADLAAKQTAAAVSATRPVISYPTGGELGGNVLCEVSSRKSRIAELAIPAYGNPVRHGYREVEGGYYYAPGKYVDAGVRELEEPEPIYELPGWRGSEQFVRSPRRL